jgi:recombination protein U
MGLEDDINITNKYYLDNDIAVIYKKPTSVTIHKAEYPAPHEAIIREAYFKTPSTTDYNGVYKGKYIDFEAKETKSKTSFPLSNIHDHQIKHLKSIVKHGGIGFIIVRFVLLDETYLLFEKDLSDFLNNEDRKSIPYEYFKEKGYLIKIKYSPRLDYLDIIDKIGGSL